MHPPHVLQLPCAQAMTNLGYNRGRADTAFDPQVGDWGKGDGMGVVGTGPHAAIHHKG